MCAEFAGPTTLLDQPTACLSTVNPASQVGDQQVFVNANSTGSGTWLTANTALFIPVAVEQPVTITQMGIIVVTQSGNCDVGIYDEQLNRLVSAGSTAVGPGSTSQFFNITDTLLNPGLYYLAMNCDNVLAAFNRSNLTAQHARACGCFQQAVGAVALPNPATPTAMAQAYIPLLVAFENPVA